MLWCFSGIEYDWANKDSTVTALASRIQESRLCYIYKGHFFLPQTIPLEHLILDCPLVCLCPFTWPSHSPIFDPPHSHTGPPYTKERTKTCIWLFVCMATDQISHSSNLTLWVNLVLFTTPMTAGKYVGLSAWQLTHVVAETCIS